MEKLAGRLPPAREASLARLHDPATGAWLDEALVLRFDEGRSATGEPLAEFHLHGGRSVVAAVLGALRRMDGLRAAEPGEFTRRAFDHGRVDLTEAEGLADLLASETQSQRRAALALAGGALSRRVAEWQRETLRLGAGIEALLDFADEGDVAAEQAELEPYCAGAAALAREMETMLAMPSAERLREGLRVVIAGPPNSGKSSLLNVLLGREAAITSAIEGTTRDVIEAPVAIGGAPFLLVDTAGLREADDEIEAIGIGRAQQQVERADLVLWLGDPAEPVRGDAILVQSKADVEPPDRRADFHVSSMTGAGLDALVEKLVAQARSMLPGEGEVAINARQRAQIAEAAVLLREAEAARDPLILAEVLRAARSCFDRLTGRAGVEEMLDQLFGRFCIGK